MLEILIAGQRLPSVNELIQIIEFINFKDQDQLKKWFLEIVQQLSGDEQLLLLTFVTGSSAVPSGGLSQMKFHVRLTPHTSEQSLPTSHTCFNVLDLPPYSSKNILEEKLLYAIRNVSSSQFGQL